MLYIRHGDKLYANGKAEQFSLDPGLTETGKEDAKTKFASLLEKYGPPTKIMSSPYLRARQTAEIAQNVIFEQTGQMVPIFYNRDIGEYLGWQRGKVLKECLTPETFCHKPIPPESIKQFSLRVKNHIKSLEKNTWNVTHGMFVQKLAENYGTELKHPGPLEGVYIEGEAITSI